MTKKPILITFGVLVLFTGLAYYLVPGVFPEFTMPWWLGGPRTVELTHGILDDGHRYTIYVDRRTHKRTICLYDDRFPGGVYCQKEP